MKIVQIQVTTEEVPISSHSFANKGVSVTKLYALDDEGNIWLKQTGGFHPAKADWEKIDPPNEKKLVKT